MGAGKGNSTNIFCQASAPCLAKTANRALFESVAFPDLALGYLPLSFYPWLIKGKSLQKEHTSSHVSVNN